MVKDADNKRRKDGEDDVVQGKSPGLIDDLAGEVVEEGELRTELAVIQLLLDQTYPELCHVQDNILVEGICKGIKNIIEARRRVPLTENKFA